MLVGLAKFAGRIRTFASRIRTFASRIRKFTSRVRAGFGIDIITCEISSVGSNALLM